LHTNGYSLARRVLFEVAGWRADSFVAELGATVGDALLAPHRSYLPSIKPILERGWIKGLAHVTGGGITENLPRILPEGRAARIELASWQPPPIFTLLQERGRIARDEMFRAFNMGIGLIAACAAADEAALITALHRAGEPGARRIGVVTAGDRTVSYL
jgi:phosphoribosylformylglycinamidine cyclo-ligase